MKKALTKRYEWLISVINASHFKTGAEIGCAQGFTTGRVLRQCPGLVVLYAVDLWAPVPDEFTRDNNYDAWDFERVKMQFKENTLFNHSKLSILKGITWEQASRVPDNSLDFVFIDAGHTFECVKNDIMAWTPKLKGRGIISGHDINMEEVLKAVTELIPNFKDTGIDHCWYAGKEDVIWG